MGMNGDEWSWMNCFVFEFLDEIYMLFIALDENRFKRLMDEIIKIAL